MLVYAKDRRTKAEAGDLTKQSIASYHATTESKDTRSRFMQKARHHGLRDSEFPLNLFPTPEPIFPQNAKEPIKLLHRSLGIAF